MTISEIDFYRYELPLTTPVRLGGTTLDYRRGLLLRLTSAEGAVGWGDAAPLPGFSAETLDEVESSARSLSARCTEVRIRPEESLDSILQTFAGEERVPPSLQFAVETAVVELLASVRGTSLPAVLGTSRPTIALNALIPDLFEGGDERAAELREAGYRAVKGKVGRGDVTQEAKRIRALRSILGDDVALRLDANRAWSMDAAETFAEAIDGVDVAYVEEPLADPGRIEEFVAQSGLPVALDETTREAQPDVLRSHAASTVVLKPTLLGGLRKTREWIRAARAHDVTPVISASYESGVGLRMLVALAATWTRVPAGLSTYDRLATDVLTPRLPLEGPTVDVEAATTLDHTIEWSQLDSVRETRS